jgi:hypothetical protein
MRCGNGALQSVWADVTGSERLLHQSRAFHHQRLVPQAAVLILEQDNVAFRV